jgi:hypothetical protein
MSDPMMEPFEGSPREGEGLRFPLFKVSLVTIEQKQSMLILNGTESSSYIVACISLSYGVAHVFHPINAS